MIFDFNSPENTIRIPSVGGKFYHLYFLNKIDGIKVPEAFCITSPDYDAETVDNRITMNKLYAIRSSAVQEDLAGKSAAGIFESYLNVRGGQELHHKIHDCFSNHDSDRVIAYHNFPEEKIKICTIVQDMIQPDVSGVLFTRNPVSAYDEYYIQTTKGSGEKLVSGRVNPDTVIIRKEKRPEDKLLEALWKAASLIENYFKFDLDIEWAWKGNQLFILQARPLRISADNPSYFWTRANIGEIIPKPLTPLSWSVFQTIIFNSSRIKYYSWLDRIFTNLIHRLPRKPPKIRSPRIFNGYLYLNMETILKTFGCEPWVSFEILEAALGFTIPDSMKPFRPELSDRFYKLIKQWIYLLELIFPWISMERKVLGFIQKNISKFKEDKSDHSIEKIVKFVFGWHLAVTERGFSHLGFIFKYLKKIQKKEFPLPEIISSLNASAPFTVNETYKSDQSLNEIRETLLWRNKNSYNDFELADSIDNESEGDSKQIANPDIMPKSDLIEESKQTPRIYSYLLNRLQASIRRREQLKSILINEYRNFKYYYLNKAKTFVEEKKIERIDDIFYFRKEEIENTLNAEIIEKISIRKNIFNEQNKCRVPVSFFGEEPGLNYDIENIRCDSLKGIGCSRGTISGIVKVMSKPDHKVKLDSSSILVTRFADPGWTPYLLKSKGMITEVGGILSHLATIARENKIPFIVGVENATRILSDNQKINMDGQTGFIQMVD